MRRFLAQTCDTNPYYTWFTIERGARPDKGWICSANERGRLECCYWRYCGGCNAVGLLL